MNRDDLGYQLELKANLTSPSKGATGCVTFNFGVNKMPTHAAVDEAIANCIRQFNEAVGCDDARPVGLRDFGFAEPTGFAWKNAEASQ